MTEGSLLDRQAEAGLDMVGITLETLQKVHSAAQSSRFLSLMRMPSLKRQNIKGTASGIALTEASPGGR